MKKGSHFLSKILRSGVSLSFILIVSICLLELVYRYQIIDFYTFELQALNPNLNKEYSNGNVLIFGDSFSASPNGYVEQLREAYPKTNFINCSVSGIGIRQHNLFFEDRLNKFKPRKILYQYYVGNDLLDIKKDLNPNKVGFFRTHYNFISDQILVLKYINSKLARFKSKPIKSGNSKSSSGYNPRIIRQFIANSDYLNETLSNSGKQKEKMEKWETIYTELTALTNIEINLLILPHCAQVSKTYAKKMIELGAKPSPKLQDLSYPLVNQMRSKFAALDPLSNFQDADKNKPLFFENDPHLNEEGQTVLAQFLIEKNLFNEN